MPMNLEALAGLLPTPAGTSPVHVNASGRRAVRAGMPWLRADHIHRRDASAPAGTVCPLFFERQLVGVGLADPASDIVVRVVAAGAAKVDAGFFAQRARDAVRVRDAVASADTTGYRLVNGPHDGYPDVVVDRYADVLVAKLYSEAALAWVFALLHPLVESLDPRTLVVRWSRNLQDRFAELGAHDSLVLGEEIAGPVVFCENGLRFEADPLSGQKTGFFLDQRDNRARVEALHARRVLNVFAYNGGFSVYAARGGADEVTSVDISRPAIAAAERNFALNRHNGNVGRCTHIGVAGDAFEVMANYAARGEQFDAVIVDPPSFAKRAAEVDGALRAYARLMDLGVRLVAPGGTFVAASCTARVTPPMFWELVRAALQRSGRGVVTEQRFGHAIDHPVRFADGEYLKAAFVRLR